MESNVTKGKWSKEFDQEYPDKISIECDAGTDNRYFIATVDFGMDQEANADLIIDAGNVFSEYGLTPSQLVEQRDELFSVLAEILTSGEWFKEELRFDKNRNGEKLFNKAVDIIEKTKESVK